MQWTPAMIRERLESGNRKWIQNAILAIYKRQTQDEQRIGNTRHHNKIGFSGAHAQRGSYLASWLLSKRPLDAKFLAQAQRIALRYTRQLAEIANANENEKAEDEYIHV